MAERNTDLARLVSITSIVVAILIVLGAVVSGSSRLQRHQDSIKYLEKEQMEVKQTHSADILRIEVKIDKGFDRIEKKL